jgi:hypothetical protein
MTVLFAGGLPKFRHTVKLFALQGVGITLAGGLFLLWLAPVWDLFQEHVLALSREIGAARLGPKAIVEGLTFNEAGLAVQFDLVGFASGSVSLLLAVWNLRHRMWAQVTPAACLALALPLFRSLTQTITANEPANDYAVSGLAAALGCGALFRAMKFLHVSVQPETDQLRIPSRITVHIVLLGIVGLWGVAFMAYQAMTVWKRSVHSFPGNARFAETVQADGLDRLRWGDPTVLETSPLKRPDFEAAIGYLRQRDVPFFVMGDSTLFYALAGKPSPQPLLYFLPSHSFLRRQIPALDTEVHAALLRNRVRIVVKEKETFLKDVRDAYPEFPKTWAWFQDNFTHRQDFGNYEIWEIEPR